jgi:ribosomal protein S18 acetylase RimI-like enzyme
MDDELPRGIRAAVAADVKALADLERSAFHSDCFDQRQLGYLVTRAQATCLVAEEPDVPVAGYAVLLHRRRSRGARLYSLAVSPLCRGRGLGVKLLDASEGAARRRGAGSVFLEVRADNRKAIRLYVEQGYGMTGGRADYYADGMAAICMRKTL